MGSKQKFFFTTFVLFSSVWDHMVVTSSPTLQWDKRFKEKRNTASLHGDNRNPILKKVISSNESKFYRKLASLPPFLTQVHVGVCRLVLVLLVTP